MARASNRTKKYIKSTIAARPSTATSECYRLKALLGITPPPESVERATDVLVNVNFLAGSGLSAEPRMSF